MFPPEEFASRRRQVRALMSRNGVDALLISTPENIYYLSGLDHMGYFAYQMLVLPLQGKPILVSRAMERAAVADQVPDVTHYGYSDGSKPLPPVDTDEEEATPNLVDLTSEFDGSVFVEPALRARATLPEAPVETTCRALAEAGLGNGHLALEEGGSFLSYRIADGIKRGMSDATWTDGTGLVDQCRQVQSPLELGCTRQAAVISDAMIQAGAAAAGVQVNKGEVMAAIYDAMFRRGGTYPGFVPLVRSSTSLVHEHGTWDDAELAPDDILFLEMSGCSRRYHAPIGRLVFLNTAPTSAYRAQEVCHEALMAAKDAIRPDVVAGDVYERWQSVLDKNGLSGYQRHHCGYSIGIGYPPSWSGGGVPLGLRAGSDMRLKAGMVFHLMSWLLRSDYGDSFLSDTVVVTDDGCDMITTTHRRVAVRR
jgi:Xaa-Pro dipeptidase